jgi:putative spermidine/putrescine transport system permease protein
VAPIWHVPNLDMAYFLKKSHSNSVRTTAGKIAITALFGLFVVPFAYLLALSIASEWRFPRLWPPAWTLEHWTSLGSAGGNWPERVLTSLVLATSVATVATGLGFLTARHLSAHPRRRLWLMLGYVPYVFSPVVYAHGLRFFFNTAGLNGTWAGVWLAQLILAYPFAFLLFFNHFDTRMRQMEELTYTLGGSSRQVLWRVWVPVSRTALLTCFFQAFLLSWFEYGLTAVIGQGQVRTLTVAVYQYIGEANQYVAALASSLVCLPPLLMLWFNHWVLFRHQTAAAQ